jgi:hypothetical protein
MGIVDGWVSQQEYVSRALEFFNYGVKVDFDNITQERLDHIHRCLSNLESQWTMTAIEIAGPTKMFRKMTHVAERD